MYLYLIQDNVIRRQFRYFNERNFYVENFNSQSLFFHCFDILFFSKQCAQVFKNLRGSTLNFSPRRFLPLSNFELMRQNIVLMFAYFFIKLNLSVWFYFCHQPKFPSLPKTEPLKRVLNFLPKFKRRAKVRG